MDEGKPTRLYIGNISASLAETTKEFEERVAKFGTILEHLELRKKPCADTYYGHITLDMSKDQYNAFKAKYNGTRFKGSNLIIAFAKPDYKAVWEEKDKNKDKVLHTHDQLKRKYQGSSREIDVIPGMIRKNKRKGWRYATYRINKKGKTVTVHCSKKKLWGYLKDKELDGLVWKYNNGQWLSGKGDTIEIIDYKGLDQVDCDNEQGNYEKDRNTKLLESMFENGQEFGNIDLEELGVAATKEVKPKSQIHRNYHDDDSMNDFEVVAHEKVQDREDSESEGEGQEVQEDDSESEPESESDSDLSSGESIRSTEDVNSNSTSHLVSEDEEEKEPTDEQEDKKESPSEEFESDEADSENEESKTDEEMESVNQIPAPGTKPPTEVLRSLFNAEENTTFKMFGGEESEEEQEHVQHVIVKKSSSVPVPQVHTHIPTSRNVGLFFPHWDSPFLHSQSQIAQVGAVVPESKEEFNENYGKKEQNDSKDSNEDQFEPFTVDSFAKFFWQKRGEMNRELRRKRRDVLRHMRKKNLAKTRAIV